MYNPTLQKMVYYIPNLEIIVVYEVDEGELQLYEIIGGKVPSLHELCSVIPEPFNKVNLYFHPDQFNEEFTPILYDSSDMLMVRGDFVDMSPFVKIPITAAF